MNDLDDMIIFHLWYFPRGGLGKLKTRKEGIANYLTDYIYSSVIFENIKMSMVIIWKIIDNELPGK